MRRMLSLLVGLMWVAAAGAADERLVFFDRLDELKARNFNGAAGAYLFMKCAVVAAEDLARQDLLTPSKLMAEAVAKDAVRQCAAEEEELAAGVTPGQASELKAMVVAISSAAALGVRHNAPTLVCAQAEWRGCSMRPIPEWKGR